MRGKKVDSEFLSNFITESVQAGLDSPEAIVDRAQSLIKNIDEEIRKMEKVKVTRSKLLDVISTFQHSDKNTKVGEIRILSLFKIQNPQDFCRHICRLLKDKNVSLTNLSSEITSKADFIFSIKQLLEAKVIAKVNNSLLRGEMYEEYMKFILKE